MVRGSLLLVYSQSLKINVWFPVLDYMLSELDRRFTSTNLGIMKSLQACRPSSSTFLDSSQLSYLANFHSVNADLLSSECVLAKRALPGTRKSLTLDSLWSQ